MSSTPPQPPRRRRIAGENKPATPDAPKPAAKSRKPAKPKPAQKTAPAAAPKPDQKKPAQKKATPKKSAPKPAPVVVESEDAPAEKTVARPKLFTRLATRAPEGSRERQRAPLALIGVAAVALAAVVFGTLFGIRGWDDWHDSHGIVGAHEKAASAASSAAETIFSYRYDKLDDHLDDSKATMTSSFAKKFESISPALNDLAPQRKIQVKASTRDAAAVDCGSECDPDRAEVLVFIDQARLADGSKDPTVFANRITMTMVRHDGRWLVDDIRAL